MKDKMFLKRLGERIRDIRKEKNITQVYLGGKLGTFHTQIGRIERGQVNSTIIMLRHIAKELGVTVNDLLNFQDKNL